MPAGVRDRIPYRDGDTVRFIRMVGNIKDTLTLRIKEEFDDNYFGDDQGGETGCKVTALVDNYFLTFLDENNKMFTGIQLWQRPFGYIEYDGARPVFIFELSNYYLNDYMEDLESPNYMIMDSLYAEGQTYGKVFLHRFEKDSTYKIYWQEQYGIVALQSKTKFEYVRIK